MKYIAIVDDEFLSNFRIDINPQTLDMILAVKDERMFERGIRLKPLVKELLVTTNGDSAYLRKEYIETLKKIEKQEMIDEIINKEIILKEIFKNRENK